MLREIGDYLMDDCVDNIVNDDSCVTKLVQEIDAFLAESQSTIKRVVAKNGKIDLCDNDRMSNSPIDTRGNNSSIEVDHSYHDYSKPGSIDILRTAEEQVKL
jgi:hypothetical protein